MSVFCSLYAGVCGEKLTIANHDSCKGEPSMNGAVMYVPTTFMLGWKDDDD